jgi:acyl carrier protein
MSTREDMALKVIAFVRRHTTASKQPLDSSTQLARDLGMDGADAYEFLDAFAREFGVDMSSFEFARYFGPEGLDPVLLLAKKKADLRPINIGDLIEAAKSKTWPGT